MEEEDEDDEDEDGAEEKEEIYEEEGKDVATISIPASVEEDMELSEEQTDPLLLQQEEARKRERRREGLVQERIISVSIIMGFSAFSNALPSIRFTRSVQIDLYTFIFSMTEVVFN